MPNNRWRTAIRMRTKITLIYSMDVRTAPLIDGCYFVDFENPDYMLENCTVLIYDRSQLIRIS